MSTVRLASSPLALDIATIDRFLAHSHRRRYPTRTDVFRPGDPAGTLYYVVSGSVSIMAEEDDDRELVLGYFGAGEFVGEMGLFVESDRREVILRTRTACELAEISYERLHQLFLGPLSADAPRLLYALGQQISSACSIPAARPVAWHSWMLPIGSCAHCTIWRRNQKR